MSDYVDCLQDELQTCYELVRKSMNVVQERQNPTITVAHLDHNMK